MLNDIIVNLPNLTTSELVQVRSQIDRLLRGKGEKPKDEGEETAIDDVEEMKFFYEVVRRTLIEHGGKAKKQLPWAGLVKKQREFHKLAFEFRRIQNYTRKYFGRLNSRNKARLYRIYAETMIELMEYVGAPVSIGTFIKLMGKIPERMDSAFPGYRANGVLHLILELGRRDHGVPEDAAHG